MAGVAFVVACPAAQARAQAMKISVFSTAHALSGEERAIWTWGGRPEDSFCWKGIISRNFKKAQSSTLAPRVMMRIPLPCAASEANAAHSANTSHGGTNGTVSRRSFSGLVSGPCRCRRAHESDHRLRSAESCGGSNFATTGAGSSRAWKKKKLFPQDLCASDAEWEELHSG